MLLVQVIVGGLLLGAIYALFSSGLTLIWGMMNFINFAHGEFVMLGMYVALLVVVWLGGGPAAFGFAAAFALFVLGVVVYLSLIRHVMRGPMLAQILSTFGLALLLRYTAFWIFSASLVVRHAQRRGHSDAGAAARGRGCGDRADLCAASPAHAHHRRQPTSGRRRGSQRRHADGYSPRSHAGARLGPGGGQRRHRRRADGDVVPMVALRRRDLRPYSLRRGHAWRLRQRAGRNVCRPHHRIDPGTVGLLVRPDLQRHRRLCAVRCVAVVAAAGIDGEGVRRMAL